MGPNDHLYPSISNIIPDIGLPEGLDFLNETAETLFDKIVYADFLAESNRQGSEYNYRLSLIAPKPVALNFLGASDLKIGLSSVSGGNGKIKVNFYWKWQILKYIRDFNIQSFSDAPREFFNLLLSISGVSLNELIGEIISTCLPSYSRIDALINRLNTERNLGIPGSVSDIESLIQFFEQNQLDGLEELFQTFINDTDLDKIWSNFLKIFERFIGAFDKKVLRSLLTPEFSIKLNDLALALYFPRKFLIPVDQNDDLIPEGSNNDTSKLEVSVGQIIYSTKNGFHFNGLSPTITLTRSSIGKTGMIISCQQAKLDLSRTSNIPEADADGRPVDFIGAYINEASITLPEKWFGEDATNTMEIYTENLLVGTGGVSGDVGIRAKQGQSPGELLLALGKKPGSGSRKGFAIGFREFEMTFRQNQITHSHVAGFLRIPGFAKLAGGNPDIEILACFEQNGDFSITASNDPGITLKFGDVFTFTVFSLTVGRDDNRVYLGTSGKIAFLGLLGSFLPEAIEIKNFIIYSDGSFELEGGAIHLPDSVSIKIGPAEVSITALHFGSHTQEHQGQLRKYKYFGFDGGISVNPGGVDARGDGIKYYFTVDGPPFHSFLKVESLAIDLIIPGNASKENAVLILKGYLALKDPEYEGSVEFILPKAKISGGAAMKYNKAKPAFLVDAWLNLPVALPLGNTGLGIFGFRGLFGLRYNASKDPGESWTDWYREPPRGVDITKFGDPGPEAKNPFSIGAGVTLATMSDDGKAFSAQLFLLLSIPNLILLEGRANVMGERVGLIDGDPPFYAMLAFSPGESIEIGFGADYFVPQTGTDRGQILSLHADVRAAYFFKNSRAWFVNFGTKNKPITAEIISLFNGYSYLMLSATGIEAGAGVNFGFDKKYAGGMVKASVRVYMDIWGRISFERPQIGGGVAVGGSVSASLLGIGFYLGIDTLLTVEVPKPFRVHGEVTLCIGVKLVVKKVEKCFTVEFTWEKNNQLDTTGVQPLPAPATPGVKPKPVQGLHIPSGKTYDIDYLGLRTALPAQGDITKAVPLDTYIDLQFEKPLIANDIAAKIGGQSTSGEGWEEVIPPARGDRQVTHRYRIKNINLYIYSNGWKEYHPYKALTDSNLWGNVNDFKIGYWQRTGGEYNKIRLLAQTPFSYTQAGLPSWYVPEEMGLTAGTLFCPETERKETCMAFTGRQDLAPNQLYAVSQLTLKLYPDTGRLMGGRLMLNPGNTVEIWFPEGVVSFSLYLMSAAPVLTVTCLAEQRDADGILTGYVTVKEKTFGRFMQAGQIDFDKADLSQPVHKFILSVSGPDQALILQLETEIETLTRQLNENPKLTKSEVLAIRQQIAILKGALHFEMIQGCTKSPDPEVITPYLNHLIELYKACQDKIKELQEKVKTVCKKTIDLGTLQTSGTISPGGVHFGTLPGTKTTEVQLPGKTTGGTKQARVTPAKTLGGISQGPVKGGTISLPNDQACQEAMAELKAKLAECKQLETTINEIQFLMDSGKEAFCGLALYRTCWLTERNFISNSLIPGQNAIEEDFQLMQEAIQKTVAPVWRPNSKFLVEVQLSDTVNGSEKGPWNFYYGFKTEGPLGHFPDQEIQNAGLGTSDHPLNQGQGLGKESPENMLKYYLDYDKCFPNADGRILYAKPLYYDQPRLLIFLKDAFAYHFFQKWPGYQGLADLDYEMKILIKDPVEDISGAAGSLSEQVIQTLPAASFFYDTYPDDQLSNDINLINNMIPKGCWTSGVQPIQPNKKYVQVTASHLKPLKLYTAIVINNRLTAPGAEKEVHRYSFQTSRYASFEEHIQSYQLKDPEDQAATMDAVFTINADLPLSQDIDLALQIVKGQNTTPDLDNTYADPFDRLTEGVLKLGTLPPPVCTEFNVIKKTDTGKVIAIWIRSPEPFNDPKIPLDQLKTTILVKAPPGSLTGPSFLFSRDGSQIFIMPETKEITAQSISVRFRYLEWDGWNYAVKATKVAGPLKIQ